MSSAANSNGTICLTCLTCLKRLAGLRQVLLTSLSLVLVSSVSSASSQTVAGGELYAVSPGEVDRTTVSWAACPTFSWVVPREARQVRGIAMLLLEDGSVDESAPPLEWRLPGGASSWTPAADQCLEPGPYVWAVSIGKDGEWSEPRYFEVPERPSDAELMRALDVVRRHLEAGGGLPPAGEVAQQSLAAPAVSPPSTRRRTGSSARSAGATGGLPGPAALRGNHTETSGVGYGVVGESHSPDGIGVYGVNGAPGGTAGRFEGPVDVTGDLDLDGAFDCVACVATTQIQNGGITAPDIANSAVGSSQIADGAIKNVDIGPGQVTATHLAADSVGATAIAAGAVASAEIADGSVTGTDVEDLSITSADIAANSIDSGRILNSSISHLDLSDGSVRTAAILDGTVTGTDIADGTLTSADVDAGGGILAGKESLYVNVATLNIGMGTCGTITVACNDANDIAINGSARGPSTAAIGYRLAYEETLAWTTDVNAAQYRVLICNDSSPGEVSRAELVCLAVD